MPRSRFVDYAVYLLVRVFICIVQALSLEMGTRLARGLAWLACDVFRIRAGVVDENLSHAFPQCPPAQRRTLARQMWEHLFLLVLEVAHAPRKIHETNWRHYVRLSGTDPLVRALLDDRPLVLVTGHFGNFEIGGFMLGILGFPTYAVARNLDNPYLDRFVSRFRRATGQYLIPKNGGYEQILVVLAGGGAVSFLADQYAGPKGCWVEFFGRKASAHKGIALLALEHDAPVAVCCARRLGRPLHFELHVQAMVDPRQTDAGVGTLPLMTQWYTRHLEAMIRQAPEQYWWLHRRWKDPRPKRPSTSAKAA